MSASAGYLLAAYLATAAAAFEPAAVERYEFSQDHMGVPVKLVLYAAGREAANDAAEAAYARIAELDQAFSDYRPDSALMRFNRTAGTGERVELSKDLWNVLATAWTWSRDTGGAFDVTVGPAVRLWRRARRERQLPSQQRLDEARSAIGIQHLSLDKGFGAMLTKPGMRIDLGGIGMGYAVDEAMKVLKRHGIASALIDASGDILVSAPPPGKGGWTIGIAPLSANDPPSVYLSLSDCAVSTSGDAFQYVEIDGRRYSHIVDPRTGLGLSQPSSVTVIAPDCTTADCLSTAVSVLPLEQGLRLIDATPGCAALVVRQEETDGDVRSAESERFGALPRVGEERD